MRWELGKATGGLKAYGLGNRVEMGRFSQSRSTRGLVEIGYVLVCIHCYISVSEPCEKGGESRLTQLMSQHSAINQVHVE